MKINKSDLERLTAAMESKNLSITQTIELINGQLAQISPDGQISLTVDYSQTVGQMIAAGKYGWKNRGISEEHFPLPAELSGQKITVSAKLFHFNRSIGSENAIAEMDKTGYRPVTLAELLALGAKYPELQCQFPIIALGSLWHSAGGDRFVLSLRMIGHGRGLNLDWFGNGWNARCRFLGVCK